MLSGLTFLRRQRLSRLAVASPADGDIQGKLDAMVTVGVVIAVRVQPGKGNVSNRHAERNTWLVCCGGAVAVAPATRSALDANIYFTSIPTPLIQNAAR